MEGIATIWIEDDGSIQIAEGTSKEGRILANLSAVAIIQLDLFFEDTYGFSYTRDAQRCARILTWLLENNGARTRMIGRIEAIPTPNSNLTHAVLRLCEPGPPGPMMFHIPIEPCSVDDETMSDRPFNDPIVDCCGRDAADCDCEDDDE